MARIKHIAIRTPDPEKTAAFYKDVFGLKEVGQARTGCYLSDGYINLAILKAKDDGDGESPRDVGEIPHAQGGRHRSVVDDRAQRAPDDELHGDEIFAVHLSNFEDGANVGMIQRRSRARF